MRIKCFTSPDMGENCYIVTGDTSKEAVVIDPGNSVKAVLSYVEREKLEVKYILQTHAHFDHICGAEKIKAATGALVCLTHEETRVAENSTYNLSSVFGGAELYTWDKELSIGEQISFGGTYCKVILTPGHTCGGCCFYFEQEGAVFSGDTLFLGSVGRTDFPTGDAETLRKSIIKSLFVLPDDTKVFSGHGMSSTIGYEKKNNIYVF